MWWLFAALVALLFGAALWGPIVSNVEHPKYRVVEGIGAIEIRDYAPMIVAEVEYRENDVRPSERAFASSADYIFGNNTAALKVPMTAPVTQEGSKKIAMTAPVTQQGDDNTWRVRFIIEPMREGNRHGRAASQSRERAAVNSRRQPKSALLSRFAKILGKALREQYRGAVGWQAATPGDPRLTRMPGRIDYDSPIK
jgi:SOUL heme-binding protein